MVLIYMKHFVILRWQTTFCFSFFISSYTQKELPLVILSQLLKFKLNKETLLL